MVNLLFFAQIRDHAGKHIRFPVLVADQLASAPQPDPFSLRILSSVFNVVFLYTSVRDLLITLKEMCLIMGVNQADPAGCRVLHHLTRQAKFLHHGRRITKHAGLHIAYKYVVICTLCQRVIQTSLVILKFIL